MSNTKHSGTPAASHTPGPWHVKQATRKDKPVPFCFELCDSVGVHAHSASREGLQEIADKLNKAEKE